MINNIRTIVVYTIFIVSLVLFFDPIRSRCPGILRIPVRPVRVYFRSNKSRRKIRFSRLRGTFKMLGFLICGIIRNGLFGIGVVSFRVYNHLVSGCWPEPVRAATRDGPPEKRALWPTPNRFRSFCSVS